MVAEPEESRQRQLSALITAIDKLVRSLKIYAGKGALVERLHEDAARRLTETLAEGEIHLDVASAGLLAEGELVTAAGAPPPYVFRLFCDGVRELTLAPGMDATELRSLAEVLGSDPMDGDSLVALLYERDLPHLRFYAADALAREASGQSPSQGDSLAVRAERRARAARTGPGGKRIALSADEMRSLILGEAQSWLADAHTPVTATGAALERAQAIRARFRAEGDVRRFMDLAFSAAGEGPSPLILSYFDAALAAEEVGPVAAILAWVARATLDGNAQAAELRSALLADERHLRLVPLVSAHPKVFLPTLKVAVEGVAPQLTGILIRIPAGPTRDALQEALEGAQIDLTPFYRPRIRGDEPGPVLEAVAQLARSSSQAATEALVEALGSNLTVVRRAALVALKGRQGRAVLTAAGRTLRDPDQENRLLATALLADAGDRRVVPMLLSAAEDPALKDREEAEHAALFGALGRYDDPRVLRFLTALLEDKNLTRQRFQLSCQILAARALGAMGSEASRETLQNNKGRWYHPGPLKQAVEAALVEASR